METPRETEAKYHLPTALAPMTLESLRLEPYALRFEKAERQHDWLLDTPDHLFYHRGYVLRLRQTPRKLLVTLKRPGQRRGSVHLREEIEAPVAKDEASSPQNWPPQLATPALALIGDKQVSPLVELDTRRETWRVERAGQFVAELVIDHGTLIAGEATAEIHELEIELKAAGAPHDLACLDRHMRKRLALSPEPNSKFARGMALLEATEQYHGGYTPVVTAGRDLIEQQAKRLRKHGEWLERHSRPHNLRGDPVKANDHVHALRIVTRRLRAALDLIQVAPNGPTKAILRLDRQLRRLRRLLGVLRDAEIVQQRLKEHWRQASKRLAASTTDTTLPQGRKTYMILRALVAQRRSAQARLHAALRDGIVVSLEAEVDTLTRRLRRLERAQADDATVVLVRQVAGSMVWRGYENVERLGAAAMRAEASPADRHRLRRACKRLRYLLEALQHTRNGPPIGDAVVAPIKQAQDHLGTLQDDTLLLQALYDHEAPDSMSSRASARGHGGGARSQAIDAGNAQDSHVGVVSAIADEAQADMAQGVAAFWPLWEQLSGGAYRAALAETIMRL